MKCGLVIGLILVCVMPSSASAQDVNGRLKVYLDCNDCFGDYIREEVDMVEYVRDPAEADVHIIVSRADTASGGVEQAVALIGLGRFKGTNFNLRAISQSGDTEDTQRQRLATAITIGLLNYLCECWRQGGIDCQGRADSAARPGGACDRSVELLGDERAGFDRDGRRRKQPPVRPERRSGRGSDYRRLEDHDGVRNRASARRLRPRRGGAIARDTQRAGLRRPRRAQRERSLVGGRPREHRLLDVR